MAAKAVAAMSWHEILIGFGVALVVGLGLFLEVAAFPLVILGCKPEPVPDRDKGEW